jgi:HAD superfamily hydrolase (TIGR01509 family)
MNIVFDIGNVLLHWDPRHLYRRIFADPAEMEWFLAHVCNAEWNLKQDMGRSFAEAVAEASSRHPRLAKEIAAFDRRWHETLPSAIEGSVDILEALAAGGAPLYAITNFNAEKFRETRVRFPFLSRFRDIVVSGEEGVVKPDAEIFRRLTVRNTLDPRTCLFIDDNAVNVAAARASGMEGHHFRTPEALREDLIRRGLI